MPILTLFDGRPSSTFFTGSSLPLGGILFFSQATQRKRARRKGAETSSVRR